MAEVVRISEEASKALAEIIKLRKVRKPASKAKKTVLFDEAMQLLLDSEYAAHKYKRKLCSNAPRWYFEQQHLEYTNPAALASINIADFNFSVFTVDDKLVAIVTAFAEHFAIVDAGSINEQAIADLVATNDTALPARKLTVAEAKGSPYFHQLYKLAQATLASHKREAK